MIRTEITGNTALLYLNRPEKRNALHPVLIKQMKDALAEYELNDDVHSVILTGEGKTFCAGADLEYLSALSENSIVENRNDSRDIAELFLKIYEFPKPIIAAVNGAAIAGGCGLVTVCDFVVAHNQFSRFGYSEVKIGFIPAIVSVFLIRRIGEGKARQLLLSGEIIESDHALRLGLVDYISEDPLKTAKNIAAKLNDNSSLSIKLTKKIIRDISVMSTREAVEYCLEMNTISRSSPDFISGINSFLKK
jgi:methylglutaconyl-CoA hydratase